MIELFIETCEGSWHKRKTLWTRKLTEHAFVPDEGESVELVPDIMATIKKRYFMFDGSATIEFKPYVVNPDESTERQETWHWWQPWRTADEGRDIRDILRDAGWVTPYEDEPKS